MPAMVRFNTKDGVCAVPAERVLGVRSSKEVKAFPAQRNDVAGLVEWEGDEVTVLRPLGSEGRHVLVIRTPEAVLGLLVDEVLGLAKVEDSAVQGPPGGRALPLVESIVKTAGGFECVISTEELSRLLGDKTPVAPPPRLDDQLPLRVLVVEDNPAVQLVDRRLLAKLGYEADVAADGKVAIEAIAKVAYDIVFMDVQMPEMDGLAAMREISTRWPADRPAIVAMTAGETESERRACLDAGMDDFLLKPAREADFRAMLRKWGTARQRRHDA